MMKNVAGFDIARLLAGSMGTLGVITEVAFKCLPLPKAQQTRVFELDARRDHRHEPLLCRSDPVTASTWVAGNSYLRLAGAESAVAAAVRGSAANCCRKMPTWWRPGAKASMPFFSWRRCATR